MWQSPDELDTNTVDEEVAMSMLTQCVNINSLAPGTQVQFTADTTISYKFLDPPFDIPVAQGMVATILHIPVAGRKPRIELRLEDGRNIVISPHTLLPVRLLNYC